MLGKKQGKINPIWYILPIVEIVGFFIPAKWVGLTGSMLLSLIIFAASIASIVGFFLLKKKSMIWALVNLVIGIIVLVLFLLFFLTGFVTAIK